jgi:hypothetical protein
MNIQEITPSQIVRAYSGKVGCMCGCKGKYYTSVADGTHSMENPGMVTRILHIIQAAPPEEIEVNVPGCRARSLPRPRFRCRPDCFFIAWVKGGQRQYVAYLTD